MLRTHVRCCKSQSFQNFLNLKRLKVGRNAASSVSARLRAQTALVAHRAGYALFVIVFVICPVARDIEQLFEGQDHADLAVIMQRKLTLLLLLPVFHNVACKPLVQTKLSGITYFGYLKLLHFVFCKPLLHAQTQEVAVVVAKSVEHFQEGEQLLVLLLKFGLVVHNCMHQATG